jgi:tetratricopeptide (TPR) repeat protein
MRMFHHLVAKRMRSEGSGRLRVEAEMAARITSTRLVGAGCRFGRNVVFIFAVALLISYTLSLVGCNAPQAGVTGADSARKIPQDARKAELLKELDRKFANPQAHMELARIYQAEGLTEKAEYHYNVALNFDPALVDAKAGMVKLFLDSNNPAKGKDYADRYIDGASASSTQSIRLGKAFEERQLDDYALKCYQQALHVTPGSARANAQLGFYYLRKGDKDQAKEYLVDSFQLDPTQPDVAGELGRLGVEVRIPQTEQATVTAKSTNEKQWRIVAKQGLIQVEPIVQKGEKKKNSSTNK